VSLIFSVIYLFLFLFLHLFSPAHEPHAPLPTNHHTSDKPTTGEPPLPPLPPQPVSSHRAGRRSTHHRAPPQIHGESRPPLRTLCSTSLSDHAPLRRTSLSPAPWRTPTAPPHSLLELLARDTGRALRQVPLGIPGCSSKLPSGATMRGRACSSVIGRNLGRIWGGRGPARPSRQSLLSLQGTAKIVFQTEDTSFW
jgi:hypothetical protein